MTDREKVIKGLECCKQMEMDYEIYYCLDECPYKDNRDCIQRLCSDALTLLKEQEVIIRCKDCKRNQESNCEVLIGIYDPDFFCADGEAVKCDD